MRGFRFSKYCTHLDVGKGEIEAAVRAAARITACAIER
jgi:hypothetical protein